MKTFQDRLEWILRNRGFDSIRDLASKSGIALGTLGNGRAYARQTGKTESTYSIQTYTKIAGTARVSLSWLQGYSASPDGDDVPAPPQFSETQRARKSAAAKIKALKAELARFRQELPARKKPPT